MDTYDGTVDASASLKCALELQAAGVPIVLLPSRETLAGIDSRVGGELGGFTFRRAFSRWYWVVRGPMPLDVAEQVYADPRGRYDVRAGGHCGARHPRDETTWRAPDGRKLAVDPDGKQRAQWAGIVERHPDMKSADDEWMWCDTVGDVPGARAYVEAYHVDTAEGLRLLADMIKSLAPASTPMLAPAP